VEKSGYRGPLDPYFPFGRCSAGGTPRQNLQNQRFRNRKGKPFAILLLQNAFACGECGVFANLLKRIGKWQSLAFAYAKTIVA
jgi:hypothetical protein